MAPEPAPIRRWARKSLVYGDGCAAVFAVRTDEVSEPLGQKQAASASLVWITSRFEAGHIDFVEDGVLLEVPMRSADGSLEFALRRHSVRAAALAGFDHSRWRCDPLRPAEVAGSVGQARRAARRHRCGPCRAG
jgi:hypothetical protein